MTFAVDAGQIPVQLTGVVLEDQVNIQNIGPDPAQYGEYASVPSGATLADGHIVLPTEAFEFTYDGSPLWLWSRRGTRLAVTINQ